jgi:hypothetical protein
VLDCICVLAVYRPFGAWLAGRRQDVEDVCGGSQSFDPVGGWKVGLEQQRAHIVVDGANDMLGLPVLG